MKEVSSRVPCLPWLRDEIECTVQPENQGGERERKKLDEHGMVTPPEV